MELSEGEVTSDYFKINDKFVKLEPMVIRWDEQNLKQEIKLETHPNFTDSKIRQASIKFIPLYQNIVATDYIVLSGKLKYIYGKFQGYVTDESG